MSVEEAYHGTERSLTISGPTAPHARRHHPGGRGRRSADPAARPGRPGQRSAAAGDLYLWSGSPTTRATGSRVATCTRSCRSRRGRPPWALRSPSTPRRRRHGEGPGRLVQPPPAAAHGRGLPNRRGKPGDLYAELQIRVPSPLTDDEQRLLRGAREGVQLRREERPMTARHALRPRSALPAQPRQLRASHRRTSRARTPPGCPRAAGGRPATRRGAVVRPLPGEGDGQDPAAADET